MIEKETKTEEAQKEFLLSDQLTIQLANLLCLAMATETHVGNHFRLIRLTESKSPGMENKLVLSSDYINEYNKQIEALSADMDKKAEELLKKSAKA